MTNKYTINFIRGDTYALAVKFKNLANELDSALFTVRESLEGDILLQASLNNGVTLVDDRPYKNEKTYKIQLESDKTKDLKPSVKYIYDFRVSVENVVQTVLSGILVVHPDVSPLGTSTSSDTIEAEVEDALDVDFSVVNPTIFEALNHSGTELTNENINDIVGKGCAGWYYASSDNTCSGVPSDVTRGFSFGLEVGLSGIINNYQTTYQIFTNANGRWFRLKQYANWTEWKKVATMDDIPTIDTTTHSYEELTDEDFGGLYGDDKVGWYYANGGNSCYGGPSVLNLDIDRDDLPVHNEPFILQVECLGNYKGATETHPCRLYSQQLWIYGDLYTRKNTTAYHSGELDEPAGDSYSYVDGWTAWKKFAKTDDIPSNYVDLVKNQEISGVKSFNNGVVINPDVSNGDVTRGNYFLDIYDRRGACDTIFGVRCDGDGADTATVVYGEGSTAVPLEVSGSVGTAGQVLTSQGDGKTPSWETHDKSKHSQAELINKDLNELYGDDKVGWYFGNSEHGVTNVPENDGTSPFYLEVKKSGYPYYIQELYLCKDSKVQIFTRYQHSPSSKEWTKWRELGFDKITISGEQSITTDDYDKAVDMLSSGYPVWGVMEGYFVSPMNSIIDGESGDSYGVFCFSPIVYGNESNLEVLMYYNENAKSGEISPQRKVIQLSDANEES